MFKTVSLGRQYQINEEIQSGVHLFHFDFGNCSQRVRICLIEKGVSWKSHPINLLLNEHSSDWFQKINRKGLVPVLVHDGKIVTESVEIIRYIDRTFPSSIGQSQSKSQQQPQLQPQLQPQNAEDVVEMNRFITQADDVQSDIKLLTHYFLARPHRFIVKMTLGSFSDSHQNDELVRFKRRFANNEFTVQEVRHSIDEMHKKIRLIDSCLIGREWLIGKDFSLADIAWMVNVHRLDLMGFPLSRYTNLQLWYRRCKERRSFQQGLVHYEPALIMLVFKITKRINRSKYKTMFGFE